METKRSRVFTKKLIALFLSMLMALSCFTGALTAYAASVESDKRYTDENLAANFMTWAEATDEQTCEALLDYADLYIGDLLSGLLGTDQLNLNLAGIIKINGYLDSIDGLYDLIRQVNGILNSYGTIVGGDVKNIDLSPIASLPTVSSGEHLVSKCGKSYRGANSAKEMIMALAKTLYINSNDFAGKNVIGQFFKGSLSLGSIVENAIGGNIYSLLQEPLGMWNGYQSDVIYNIVANLILKNTKWFDEATTADFYAQLQSGNRTTFNFDDVLFDALNRELLQKISVLVTYPTYLDGQKNEQGQPIYDSSYSARKAGRVINPKLVYSPEFVDADGVEMNVFLFQYDFNGDGVIADTAEHAEKLTINKSDTLFSFGFRALEFAWNTVLADTIGLLHVNYDVDRGHGANFDNVFYYWYGEKGYTWDRVNWKSNYSKERVEEWAADAYAGYGAASPEEFLENVRHTFEYDRSVVADPKNNWRDIDASTLFNKLRYNPLADLYFDMQTGPINLYFMQTGTADISSFFETAFTKYDNIVSALNDALVSATKVLFMDSKNIGYGTTADKKVAQELSVPTMKTTGNILDNATISSTLVGNFMDMFEYAANAADANILAPYYTAHGISTLANNLSEDNMEEAVVPLLVTCINQIDMVDPIHDERWDKVVDAEGVAVLALEEYLSYVLPDKDYTPLWTETDTEIKANDGQDLFVNAVLPMVRDALSYIIQSAVPCRGADNQPWNVYERAVDDPTTIFDILNSVIVYYASTDGYGGVETNTNGIKINNAGKAVAALLGAVDENGYNLVKKENDIWQNLDAVANKLFPIAGVFQKGTRAAGESKLSTKELIYDDIITGFLDIATVHDSGLQGISNFINKLLIAFTSDPIANNYGSNSLTVMIYDILADEINTIFGARYAGQGYKKVIPNSEYYDRDNYSTTKSSTPFDSLLTVGTLGNYSATKDADTANGDGYKTGVIGILICNIYEIFGGTNYAAKANNGKVWTGAMFAVQAVNNFIPSFIPQLSPHSFYAATAKLAKPAQNGLTAGNAFAATTLDITNNSKGLNRFYKDANGNIAQLGRYYIEVTNVAVKDGNGNSASNIVVAERNKVIAPGKTAKISISGTAPSVGTTYAFDITYDVYMAKHGEIKTAENIKFTGLTTTAYMFLTPEKDWQATVYPSDRYSSEWGVNMFPTSMEYKNKDQRGEYTHSTGNADSLIATLPNDFIVKMSNPSEISNNGILVRNTNVLGAKAFDGVITYIKSGTEYYPVSNGVISDTLTTQASDNNNVGYAAIDPATGDILNYEFFDYSLDGGKNFVRKNTDGWTYGKHGYTQSEIDTIKADNPNAEFVTRPHVVLTLEEALKSGLVYGVKRTPASTDSDGNLTYLYDAVLIDLQSAAAKTKPSGSKESVNTLLLKGKGSQDSISWGTPTPGLYLAAGKQEVAKSSNYYTKFVVYDGTTELSATDYLMNVCVWRTAKNNMNGTIHMYICDDAAANSLNSSYNAAVKNVSTYMASDIDDYDTNTKKSESYDNMQKALADAVATMGTPIRSDNAGNIGSNVESTAKKGNTTSELHKDIAYAPIPTTTAIPASIMVNATKGTDGYWYANKECTLPIYSKTELTDAMVTNGTNAVGEAVAKGADGKYHLINTPVYVKAWDTTTYNGNPYLYETEEQLVDAITKAPIYGEISFVYRDKDGNKCTSNDDWAYKLAEQQTTIIPNDPATATENRGVFQISNDKVQYYLEQLRANINGTFADKIGKGVSEDRADLNNVNFEVASYEKMVQVAKDAEELITTTYVDGPEVDEFGKPIQVPVYSTDRSSLEIEVAKDMYDTYKGFVVTRNYKADNIGAKLEKEIVCASNGYTYDQITAVPTQKTDELGNPIDTYDITINGVALENTEGYTAKSWQYYTWALGRAVNVAKSGNANDGVENTTVSNVYTVRTDLMRAENNLTVDDTAKAITVSGKVMIAENLDGTSGQFGVGGIEIRTTAGTVLGTSAADGSFSVEAPIGTTELVFAGPTTIDRTVTLSGTADVADVIVPVVICDYNHDGSINSTDTSAFSKYFDEFNVYGDFNVDGEVNSTDSSFYSKFIDMIVSYAALQLD